MRTLLLIFVLPSICVGGEQKSASIPQANEVTWRGMTLNQWIAMAKDKDASVRRDATDAIGKINLDAKMVAPVLSALLKDKNSGVRRRTAEASGQRGPRLNRPLPHSRNPSKTRIIRYVRRLLGLSVTRDH